MLATHRVKDSNSKTVGFLLDDGGFYTDYSIINNISIVENLTLLNNGALRCDRELPIINYKVIVKNEYKKLAKQNPFKRDIQEQLLDWKKDSLRKVLQVEGARQIGKTTELKKFAYKNYEYVIYVNLGNDTFDFVGTVINGGINSLSMEMYCRKVNLPHYVNSAKTLLIIDEIQTNSKVYNSIRTLNDNLNCDLIVTGSYLGQTLKKEFFQPMGTVSILKMFPLSFKEFCGVVNKHSILANVDLYGSSLNSDYKDLYNLYDIYKQVGGYPEVVKTYFKYKDIGLCEDVISNLLEIFEKESRNYFQESKETLIFNTVYTQAIYEMNKESKGTGSKLVETVTNLVKDSQKMMVSRDEVSRAIQWLVYSGIIGECDLCNNGDVNDILPARRLYYMDCGIASYIARQTGIPQSNIDGLLTETFVYSELYRLYATIPSKKKVKGKIPCFSVLGNYELDFMILGIDNTVYGLEAKTVDGDPISLRFFISKRLVDKGVVAKRTKGGKGDKYDTIPIFSVGARFPYK